ncbi:TPA: class I SAM-dependent methyltransferase [Vibrio cholerae]|nr:class I SAM-dependent methyltransferase [Vibrio cholerae]
MECRLCGGRLEFEFDKFLLERWKVKYFCCDECGSLQTEVPYWLDLAYSSKGCNFDVGQGIRIINTWLRLTFFLKTIGFDDEKLCVDYGGSTGLFSRLMRDADYNFYTHDKYEFPTFCDYFSLDSLEQKNVALLSAFEVFEHFESPKKEINRIFDLTPELVVFTTQTYDKQLHDEHWPYLASFCGQHIFFYTERSLQLIAHSRGYKVYRWSIFYFFVRKGSPYDDHSIFEKIESPSNEELALLLEEIGWGGRRNIDDFNHAVEKYKVDIRFGNRAIRYFFMNLKFRSKKIIYKLISS